MNNYQRKYIKEIKRQPVFSKIGGRINKYQKVEISTDSTVSEEDGDVVVNANACDNGKNDQSELRQPDK